MISRLNDTSRRKNRATDGSASQRQALALFGDIGNLFGQAYSLNDLGVVQQETGDHAAAAASQQQALALFRDLGNLFGQTQSLNDLGLVQQETGDHAAAAASQQQALTLFTDLGNRLGQAEALNRLGELAAPNRRRHQTGGGLGTRPARRGGWEIRTREGLPPIA